MQKMHCNGTIWCLLYLGTPLIMAFALPAAATQAVLTAKTTEATMSLVDATTVARAILPPIDREAPTAFETASFGLG